MNGQELLERWIGFLRRYLVLSDAQYLVLALWAMHTWMYDSLSRTTPYLEITGVSGSGKTTVMEALALLSRGSLTLNTLRTLSMCRYITEHDARVTLFIDEAEKLSSASYGDQRSMLASGYRRGGVHLVTVGKGTAQFEVWCPKAFTSTRTMTHVLHNRCIPIWVELGSPEARLGLEAERAEATAAELTEALKGVLPGIVAPRQNFDALRALGVSAEQLTDRGGPAMRVQAVQASWLHNERDQEIWTPLITLAHTLRLRQNTIDALVAASVDLAALRGVERRCDVRVADEDAAERSYARRLLADALTVAQEGESFIPSGVLVDRLRLLPAAPWRVYQRSGLTEITLAQLLGAHGIQPVIGQIGKGRKDRRKVRGYRVRDLTAAKRTE